MPETSTENQPLFAAKYHLLSGQILCLQNADK